MSPSTTDKTPNKLSGALARVLPHLQLDAEAKPALAGCDDSLAALDRLEQAGLLIEATRLVAHALPAREAVWWACACSRHTAPSGANPALETTLRDAAEEWVRRPTDEHRRTAMKQAETAGFGSAEAWAAVAAFWSGDSMAPPEAPKVPPQPHFTGLAVAGAVALAAARGPAARRETRLRHFLVSAKDIAAGGVGRIEPETD
ncbi:MAG TPA: hypothetical protein VI232_13635 [Reyranella sp.]